MYTLIRSVPLKQLLSEQAPAIALALLVAELFYKFHSFTLECVAFLATWCVIDALIQLVHRLASTLLRGSSARDAAKVPPEGS
jgi:hypothetical protein